MNAGDASVLIYMAGAWLLQLALFADFAAEARALRKPRRSVDLLNWSNEL